VIDCPPGIEYDEHTFSFFADLERRRAARSGREVFLLLASIERAPGQPTRLPAVMAKRLMEAFRQSLRDTDVCGWYRQDLVAGAVLDGADAEATAFRRRVEQVFSARLPVSDLRIRVVSYDAAFGAQPNGRPM
jgi:hypothetical protein